MPTIPDLDGLPGAERVERGLADLGRGRLSQEALWLAAAAVRLRSLGLPVPLQARLPGEPEIALYEALGAENDDPYYRYNALRAELDSFLAALEARVERIRAREHELGRRPKADREDGDPGEPLREARDKIGKSSG